MKTCAVPSCKNDSSRRPELSFFSLPRDSYVKGEWLDVLGIKRGEATYYTKICEVHFRAKDFCAGKKQLKSHAIPVLKLGSGKSEPVDSDDEFVHCDSDSDPEIVEIKKLSPTSSVPEPEEKIETDAAEEKSETKKNADDSEHETGRRPSRRAARVAAKKIYNTVRNYGLSVEADDDNKAMPSIHSVLPKNPHIFRRQRWRAFHDIKVPPSNIDLEMECYEELLSSAQAEQLLKSQLEYNMVMKSLRVLKASNVKIICYATHDAKHPDPSTESSLQNENDDTSAGSPQNASPHHVALSQNVSTFTVTPLQNVPTFSLSSPRNTTSPNISCSVASPQSSSSKSEIKEASTSVKSPNIITVFPLRQDNTRIQPDNSRTVFPMKLSTAHSPSLSAVITEESMEK